MKRSMLLLLLTLPAFGFTNCEYFTVVNVPRTDANPPLASTRIFEHGGADDIELGDVSIVTHDLDSFFTLMPYGFDGGGLERLELQRGGTIQCPAGDGLSSIAHLHFPTEVEEEPVGPGDPVSNGRFFIFTFDPAATVSNPACIYTIGWTVTATDGHGNVSSAHGSITYRP